MSIGKLPEVVLSVLTVVKTGKWTPTSSVSDERTAMVSDTCKAKVRLHTLAAVTPQSVLRIQNRAMGLMAATPAKQRTDWMLLK